MAENTESPMPTLEERLIARYGELLELSELASLLKYKSPLALKRAIAAKQLDIELSRVGARKVVATSDVARLLIKAGINPRPGSSYIPPAND